MSVTARPPARAAQQPDADPTGTPLLVAVPDAARLLGIGPTFAWELVRAGGIPSVNLGRRVLVPRAALECLAGAQAPIAAHGRDGPAPAPAPYRIATKKGDNDGTRKHPQASGRQ